LTQLRINQPGVIYEAIDGEVVIVNVDNGLYFSSDGVGAKLWSMIAQDESVESLIEWACGAYDTPATQVEDEIKSFVEQLTENELVLLVDATADANGEESTLDQYRASEPASEAAPAPAAWTQPELNVYSDMEELLLLDPVHDAGEEGWPQTAPDATASQQSG
jgi:hypothetical protein